MTSFYLSPEKWSPTPSLEGDEASHVHVLRLKAGDTVRLFDGEGRIGLCRIQHAHKKNIKLELIQDKIIEPPRSRAIIAIAISKAARRGFFLEKASELGAWQIWLWQAQRSQGKLSQKLAESCKGQLIAGLKQSGNPWLPQLKIFTDAAAVASSSGLANLCILPWEEQTSGAMLDIAQIGQPGTTIYAIGPEGGLSEEEVDTFRKAGFITVSLGNRVLRCETAATLCLGLHWWASQLPGHPDSHAGLSAP